MEFWIAGNDIEEEGVWEWARSRLLLLSILLFTFLRLFQQKLNIFKSSLNYFWDFGINSKKRHLVKK